jgi:hypothetical protein
LLEIPDRASNPVLQIPRPLHYTDGDVRLRPAQTGQTAARSPACRSFRGTAGKLISELKGFTDTDTLTAWAQRILPLKNQLTTSDAQEVENAFATKLSELGNDVAPLIKSEVVVTTEVGGDGEPTTAKGNAIFGREPGRKPERPKSGRKLNGSRIPRRAATSENGSVEDVPSETAEQLVTPLSKELRLRDRDHLKFVSTQPCLACGRSPSDAHHLRFAQQRALGRKVSNEFTVRSAGFIIVSFTNAEMNSHGGSSSMSSRWGWLQLWQRTRPDGGGRPDR